eukprot:CAMPEP_0114342666 /NCGR_PEP_ID=MMETSP0101-20121206/9984_1 /TAXON_ID=38822 ORGANISM="Pteridomonas danica, Strain PT" /NCGR_SAMPLE_ID=MMETSP0101 /ASSEMBLY_ACC=CAM_ASM_000211 /LENGTH=223 /DNA_ID=CAMNT_0001476915 /DNA_START=705 /DNA_END=1379 /DNA_ORIENTATION=+
MEWSLPVLPDDNVWSNHYRYVSFDDDPISSSSTSTSTSNKRKRINEGMIVNAKNEYNVRSQTEILTSSFILPSSSSSASSSSSSSSSSNVKPYEWQRQYSMHLETKEDMRGNYLFFVDQENGQVTFKDMVPQKLELRGGISATQERLEEKDQYAVCRRELIPSEVKENVSIYKTLKGGGGDMEEEEEEEDDDEVEEDDEEDSRRKSPLPPDNGSDSESGLSDA